MDAKNTLLATLSNAADEMTDSIKEFARYREELARKAQRMLENKNLRSAMSEVGFVQATLQQVDDAKARLATAIEKLRVIHYLGREAFALTAEEFAATTGLDADTYEKAVAK